MQNNEFSCKTSAIFRAISCKFCQIFMKVKEYVHTMSQTFRFAELNIWSGGGAGGVQYLDFQSCSSFHFSFIQT